MILVPMENQFFLAHFFCELIRWYTGRSWVPLLEKCRDGGGHLGTRRIYIPGAANMTSQYVMYMKIIKYKSSPASGDKHINYKTYSVLFGVSTGLSASLRGSLSFVGPRPLRFLDDLFIDPVPTDCAPCSVQSLKMKNFCRHFY